MCSFSYTFSTVYKNSSFDLLPQYCMSMWWFDKLTTEPNNTSVGQIVAKVLIGLVIGLIIAFLVFIITILFNTMITQWVRALSSSGSISWNPVLPGIFMLIAFIASLTGNIIVATVYNLLYTSKYYDMSKMLSLILISQIIIFFILAPVYILFWDSILWLFIIVAFHSIFSVFISYSLMEFTTNPNYSASNLIGGVIWFCITLLVFLWFYRSFGASDFGLDSTSNQKIKLLIAIPPLLSYTLIPLCYCLREKLYYKFYEMGNNFFFVPSLSDVVYDQSTGKSQNGEEVQASEDDINVDL